MQTRCPGALWPSAGLKCTRPSSGSARPGTDVMCGLRRPAESSPESTQGRRAVPCSVREEAGHPPGPAGRLENLCCEGLFASPHQRTGALTNVGKGRRTDTSVSPPRACCPGGGHGPDSRPAQLVAFPLLFSVKGSRLPTGGRRPSPQQHLSLRAPGSPDASVPLLPLCPYLPRGLRHRPSTQLASWASALQVCTPVRVGSHLTSLGLGLRTPRPPPERQGRDYSQHLPPPCSS